jgi:hypothetical protein
LRVAIPSPPDGVAFGEKGKMKKQETYHKRYAIKEISGRWGIMFEDETLGYFHRFGSRTFAKKETAIKKADEAARHMWQNFEQDDRIVTFTYAYAGEVPPQQNYFYPETRLL